MFIFFSNHIELSLTPSDQFEENADCIYPPDAQKSKEELPMGRKEPTDENSKTSTAKIAVVSPLPPSTQGLETETGIQQK